jgi:hypothetical protein
MSNSNDMRAVPTIFYLMAQYQGRAVVPLEIVCRDYFPHLSVQKLLRKCLRGELALPIYRSELSQKSGRGVHINDLGAYIDKRRDAAIRERDQLCGLD